MIKRLFAVTLLSVALVAGVVGVWSVQAQDGGTVTLASLPVAPDYQPNSVEQAMAALYEQVTPSVVNITVIERFGGGTGSGFVIDEQGHIVTNNHVVEDADYIEVRFVSGQIAEATLIGRDPDSDLAVIKVNPTQVDLQPIAFADSDQVFVGQQVFALGSPFEQGFTLTTGIISALDRSLRNVDQFSIPELIQTDAAINPGNSGGPLLDWDGNVIGVNTAILSESGTNSGVGFSIPSNTVRRVIPYLIEEGSYEHSWLGIAGLTMRPEQRAAMNLDASIQGVMISEVAAQGPAANAGLNGASNEVDSPIGSLSIDGDIIIGVNDEEITTMDDLISYLETSTLPGDTITLSVWRAGQIMNLDVQLEARP